jgi:hypothetical protein
MDNCVLCCSDGEGWCGSRIGALFHVSLQNQNKGQGMNTEYTSGTTPTGLSITAIFVSVGRIPHIAAPVSAPCLYNSGDAANGIFCRWAVTGSRRRRWDGNLRRVVCWLGNGDTPDVVFLGFGGKVALRHIVVVRWSRYGEERRCRTGICKYLMVRRSIGTCINHEYVPTTPVLP